MLKPFHPQELEKNVDFDVRQKAIALLKKFPLSACTDTYLIQQYNANARKSSGAALPLYMRMGYTDRPGGKLAEILAPEPGRPGGRLPLQPSTTPPLSGDAGAASGAGVGAGMGSRLQRSSLPDGMPTTAGLSGDAMDSEMTPGPPSASQPAPATRRSGPVMRPLTGVRPPPYPPPGGVGLPPLPPAMSGGAALGTPMDSMDSGGAGGEVGDGGEDQLALKRRRSVLEGGGGPYYGGRGGGPAMGGPFSGAGRGGYGQQMGGYGQQHGWYRPQPEPLPWKLTAEHLFERLQPDTGEGEGQTMTTPGANESPRGCPSGFPLRCITAQMPYRRWRELTLGRTGPTASQLPSMLPVPLALSTAGTRCRPRF